MQEPVSARVERPRLPESRVYARTLHRAAELLGGVDALSRHLGVPAATIARWIAGVEQPPLETFLAAVDIVLLGAEPGSGRG